MTIEGEKHLIASPGKIFRRIGTSELYGSEIFLGFSYYRDGVKLTSAHLDTAEDFEEIDPPTEPNPDDIPDAPEEGSEEE